MPGFRTLVRASTVATFILIAIGGLVRATESGLGCGDDWPDCNGQIVPLFDGYTVVIEYGHRMVAGIVMILLGLTALSAFRTARDVPRLVWTSVAAFGLVLFQAALGGLVVTFDLEANLVLLHLTTALSLLALLVYLRTSVEAYEGAGWPTDAATSRSAVLAAGAVLVLILIGGYLSEFDTYRSPAAAEFLRDWPLMGGKLIPDLSSQGVAWHFLHRVASLVVGILLLVVLGAAVRRKSELPRAARAAHAAGGLFLVQVLIGLANVLSGLAAGFVALHLAVAAAVWASLVAMAVVSSPRVLEVRTRARSGRREPAAEGA